MLAVLCLYIYCSLWWIIRSTTRLCSTVCVWWQNGAEPKNVAFPSRKVALPESFDDWDDFDLNLSVTKNKPKPNDSPITKPVVSIAPATVPMATVVARKKSLFDDDDDDLLWVWFSQWCEQWLIVSMIQSVTWGVMYREYDSVSDVRSVLLTCILWQFRNTTQHFLSDVHGMFQFELIMCLLFSIAVVCCISSVAARMTV